VHSASADPYRPRQQHNCRVNGVWTTRIYCEPGNAVIGGSLQKAELALKMRCTARLSVRSDPATAGITESASGDVDEVRRRQGSCGAVARCRRQPLRTSHRCPNPRTVAGRIVVPLADRWLMGYRGQLGDHRFSRPPAVSFGIQQIRKRVQLPLQGSEGGIKWCSFQHCSHGVFACPIMQKHSQAVQFADQIGAQLAAAW
jgi:hypothetical protein